MSRNKCEICKCKRYILIKALDQFKIVRCSDCHHVYLLNPIENTHSKINSKINIKKPKKRHYYINNLIKREANKENPVDVIEIGSGHGELGYLLQFQDNITYIGYEPDSERAEYCAKNNVSVRNEYFKFNGDKFDFVVLDNVLEHLINYETLLNDIYLSLRENGKLILIVPNLYDIRRFIPKWRRRHYWQPTCHVNYFSFRDIMTLAQKHGFVVDFFPFGINSPFSYAFFMKQVLDKFFRISGLYIVMKKMKSNV